MPPPAALAPSVRIDGQISTLLTTTTLSLRVEEDRLSGRHGVLHVGNWAPATAGVSSFPALVDAHRIGSLVEVLLGDAPVFGGCIVGHEMHYGADQPPTAAFLLADKLALARRDFRQRSFADISLGDIITAAASDLGFQAEVPGATPMLPRLEQRGQSTWALLSSQLARHGYYWRLDGNTLRVAPCTALNSPSTTQLELGGNLTQFDARADALPSPTEARSAHWNPAAGQRTTTVVSKTVLNDPVFSGRSGAEVAQTAFGPSTHYVDNADSPSKTVADTITEAAFRAAANGFMTAIAITTPQPSLRVGASVEILGVDAWSGGKYYVRGVTHTFDQEKGSRTELVLERPTIGYESVKKKRADSTSGKMRPTAPLRSAGPSATTPIRIRPRRG